MRDAPDTEASCPWQSWKWINGKGLFDMNVTQTIIGKLLDLFLFNFLFFWYDFLHALIPQLQKRTIRNQDWTVCIKCLWFGLVLQTVMFQHPMLAMRSSEALGWKHVVLVQSGDGLLMPESRGISEMMLLGCHYSHSVAFRCLSGPSINFNKMVEFRKSFRE